MWDRHSLHLRSVQLLIPPASDQASCFVGCDSGAAILGAALAVLSYPFAGVLLPQLVRPGVSAALLAVALLLPDERVVLPFLAARPQTRMNWDRSRSILKSMRLRPGLASVTRRILLIEEELPAP